MRVLPISLYRLYCLHGVRMSVLREPAGHGSLSVVLVDVVDHPVERRPPILHCFVELLSEMLHRFLFR